MSSDQIPQAPAESAPEPFEDAPPGAGSAEFQVELGSFEGPLDLLLTLARKQKVDIRHLSILRLADQYLDYIAAARSIRLEIAADYLVMAAWLAYLKSRLLLPDTEAEDEPSGDELAARLQHRLRRLAAMRKAGEELMRRNRLGQDVFARGMPEGIRVVRHGVYDCSLNEILQAYGAQAGRSNVTTFQLRPVTIVSVEEAMQRLSGLLGGMPDWATMESFLPEGIKPGVEGRSAVSSTFSAMLELVRQGKASLRQGQNFGPIFIKASDRAL